MSKSNKKKSVRKKSSVSSKKKVISIDTNDGYDSDFESRKNIVVYTDGSCSRNGRTNSIGGIGIHFPDGTLPDISKVFPLNGCTNQRTELYAILSALRYINENMNMDLYNVYVKTDSEYSINCLTKWAPNWIKNDWIKADGKPVLNKELIENIYKYIIKYHIYLQHVRAHTGLTDYDSKGNAEADRLATNATKLALQERRELDEKLLKKGPNNLQKRKKPSTGSKTSIKLTARKPAIKARRPVAKTTRKPVVKARKPVIKARKSTYQPVYKPAVLRGQNIYSSSNKKSAENLIIELVKSK
jgi:ribonuclease HI